MSYGDKVLTSIHGRRLGLQQVTSGVMGTSKKADLLVGAEALRAGVTTAETTAINLAAWGVSRLTTAVSSGVYTLDPPIPGVEKTIIFDTTGTNPIYVKTADGEYIHTTQGTTYTTISSSQGARSALCMIGVSTSEYAVLGPLSSGYLKASATT
jgi:hypothetical protein